MFLRGIASLLFVGISAQAVPFSDDNATQICKALDLRLGGTVGKEGIVMCEKQFKDAFIDNMKEKQDAVRDACTNLEQKMKSLDKRWAAEQNEACQAVFNDFFKNKL